MSRTLLYALAPLLLLAGCGGDPESAAPAGTPAASTTAPSEAASGPVDETEGDGEGDIGAGGSVTTEEGSYVLYPDGMRVTITSVTTPDPARFPPQEEGHVALAVTQHWENTGPAPIEFNLFENGDQHQEKLVYGPNGFDAPAYAVGGEGTEVPERLVPGTTLDITSYHSFPAEGLDVLAYTVAPMPLIHQPYTFTDVETLLSGD